MKMPEDNINTSDSFRIASLVTMAVLEQRLPDSLAAALKVATTHSIVVLVDEEVTRDKRVLASLAEYKGTDLRMIDCSDQPGSSVMRKLKSFLGLIAIAPAIVASGFSLWGHLKQLHGLNANRLFRGLGASLRTYFKIKSIVARLRPQMQKIRLVHAHNLFCGVIGAELARLTGVQLIYDAHEIEFHRNRNNSWFRAAFDSFLESMVVAHADEIRVVNVPISILYQRIYRIAPEKIRVVPNNHFSIRSNDKSTTVPHDNKLTFVYVGGGVKGRQLEQLANEASRLNIPVHAFFIYDVPEVAIANRWVIGARDYEAELVALVATHRCVMWCCVDDVCLSYRLSLPNKFFQALAVGIPIVASSGTYLADLTEAHEIGFVFDGYNIDKIVKKVQGIDFVNKRRRIHDLRIALALGLVTV